MSLQKGQRPAFAKMEHNTESMAMRIPHPRVIRFFVVHSKKNEGYSFWWNGGTLREMMRRNYDYPNNIALRVMYEPRITEEEIVAAKHLKRFRAKRTELAWAILHIMNAVHIAEHLHNDISPGNIMFHFLEDESRVYIGVCDWRMTTMMSEPMKSLYTFTSTTKKDEAIKRRWWVDPAITYVHKRDADVQNIPSLSMKSNQFAVAKLTQQINRECMSEAYHKLQRESSSSHVKYLHEQLAEVFDINLRRVQNKESTLAEVIYRFTMSFNWPMPDKHFHSSY